MKSEARCLTARQAASALGVSLPTLYSYVSRGMLRSESVAGKPRVRRYWQEDVARLLERKDLRRNPAKAAARGLHWGSPVLESALTLIEQGRLYYRGIDALELARQATLEQVAALLWTSDSTQAAHLFARRPAQVPPGCLAFLKRAPRLGPVERCQLVLPLAASTDPAAYDLRPDAAAKTGARILRLLFAAVSGVPAPAAIDASLVEAWLPKRTSAAPALRAALILCADHELNVSAFTARCIASARATPYEVVLGALAALRGTRHGGASEQVAALFEEAARTRRCREVLANRLRSLGALPGFGHRLYPEGDPRARLLISLAKLHGRAAAGESIDSLVRAAWQLTGEYPNLDFGLAAVARALELPPQSGMALFALGRAVGWIAHAIEQYADDQLIRPRARYAGPPPGPSAMPQRRPHAAHITGEA